MRFFATEIVTPNPGELLLRLISLDETNKSIRTDIKHECNVYSDLEECLKFAPKRPRSRSKEASIAASGSKAIRRALVEMQSREPLIAWETGTTAAQDTATKYKMAVPASSLSAMEQTWMDCFPGWRLVQENGVYRVVASG